MAARRLELDDDGCMGFLRCLHQAKSIVHQLEKLIDTTSLVIDSNLDAIESYVETTFNKFLRLLHTLLAVLARMESQPHMSKIRIASFRNDLDSEWRAASAIYRAIRDRIQQQRVVQSAPSPAAPKSSEGSASSWSPNSMLPTY